MSAISPALAFIAGALSILSPCVLPLLPIVLGGAASRHRWGPFVLAGGLATSFTLVGLFVATIGFSLGADTDLFREIGGFALVVAGAVLVTPALSSRLTAAAGPVTAWGQQRLTGFDASGLWAQGVLGVLLGLVWSPCVGPTLGAASLLAAQGRDLGQVGLVMLAFGLGAAGGLALVGHGLRKSFATLRGRMRQAGETGRRILGLALMAIGIAILTGLDRSLETWLVQVSPLWLTQFTTRL